MGPQPLRRYRAERLLRQEFEGLRGRVIATVRGRLRASGVSLDPSDLEACYAQAWQGLYMAVLDGQQIANPTGWLVLVTFRRAIEEHRARRRLCPAAGGGEPIGARGAGAPTDGLPAAATGADGERDFAAELDDRVRLRQLFEGLRGRLTARELEAAALCYLQGLSRSQAAARMGVSEARMRKLMDGQGIGRPGVAGKVGALADTIRNGGWCEEQGSLMRGLAFGILDPAGRALPAGPDPPQPVSRLPCLRRLPARSGRGPASRSLAPAPGRRRRCEPAGGAAAPARARRVRGAGTSAEPGRAAQAGPPAPSGRRARRRVAPCRPRASRERARARVPPAAAGCWRVDRSGPSWPWAACSRWAWGRAAWRSPKDPFTPGRPYAATSAHERPSRRTAAERPPARSARAPPPAPQRRRRRVPLRTTVSRPAALRQPRAGPAASSGPSRRRRRWARARSPHRPPPRARRRPPRSRGRRVSPAQPGLLGSAAHERALRRGRALRPGPRRSARVRAGIDGACAADSVGRLRGAQPRGNTLVSRAARAGCRAGAAGPWRPRGAGPGARR